MKTIKVNIHEFMDKHASRALIPEDIMAKFNDCFLRGEEYADIRSTIYEEIKIRQFYDDNPDLRPQTDWETIRLSRKMIDLMKRYIKGDKIEDWELSELQKQIAILIDKRKVKNKPNNPIDELEALYEDVVWLKCDILKQ